MDADCVAYLQVSDATFEESDAALLRAIAEEGSLNAAADALGRSYSRAHKRLTELEEKLGPLVERERGGEGGGGSALTDEAGELLARYARVQAVLSGTVGADEVVLSGEVRSHEGRLVAVESAAGEVRALAATDSAKTSGQRVEVTLTADAVTLQDPEGSPTATETSANNRLRGTVQQLDERAGVVTVTVDVGAERPLSVLVTKESAERLGLRAGRDVIATFKATAARATALTEA